MKNTYLIHKDYDEGYENKNIDFLLGFSPSLGTVIFDENTAYFIFDARYIGVVEKNKPYIKKRLKQLFLKDYIVSTLLLNSPIFDLLRTFIENKKIVIEESLPVGFYKKIKGLNPESIEIITNVFENQRLIKSKDEINNIKKAVSIINTVYKKVENLNKKGELKGKKEIDLRKIIQKLILESGGEKESFPTIVAFGKNSAIPHHEAGNTIIKDGPLLIDMGCIFKGYCSDFMCTFWVGEKNKLFIEFSKVKKIVVDAHNLGLKSLKEGMSGRALDKIVRTHIDENGYGEYFTHSTGHGVGLQIHELPRISPRRGEIELKKGMVFTIEPGIYLPGKFGFRWENIVIML